MISEEHKAKLIAGRIAYQAKRREEKALALALEKEKAVVLTPEEKLAIARDDNKIENSRQSVLKTIHRNKKDILDAQIEAAKGISYIGEFGTKVFKKAPDTKVGEFLLNQLIGKPTESMEIKQITKIQVDL